MVAVTALRQAGRLIQTLTVQAGNDDSLALNVLRLLAAFPVNMQC